MGEFEAIETHPNRPDTQIITFKDRPTAETFMYGSKDIPGVGKLESSFFNPPSVSSLTTAKQGANGDAGTGPSSTDGENGGKGTELAAEVDWDVADDEDWK